MSDYKRIKIKGGTYFFTVVLADRSSTLLTKHYGNLISTFNAVKKQRPFQLNALVVLPDHLHCIWTLPNNDEDYPGRWRRIKTEFSKYCRNTIKSDLEIWQPRYWEHTIRSQLDFVRHFDYIHINPLKHGYVNNVNDWPFSSFHFYVSKQRYSLSWCSDDPALDHLNTGE